MYCIVLYCIILSSFGVRAFRHSFLTQVASSLTSCDTWSARSVSADSTSSQGKIAMAKRFGHTWGSEPGQPAFFILIIESVPIYIYTHAIMHILTNTIEEKPGMTVGSISAGLAFTSFTDLKYPKRCSWPWLLAHPQADFQTEAAALTGCMVNIRGKGQKLTSCCDLSTSLLVVHDDIAPLSRKKNNLKKREETHILSSNVDGTAWFPLILSISPTAVKLQKQPSLDSGKIIYCIHMCIYMYTHTQRFTNLN